MCAKFIPYQPPRPPGPRARPPVPVLAPPVPVQSRPVRRAAAVSQIRRNPLLPHRRAVGFPAMGSIVPASILSQAKSIEDPTRPTSAGDRGRLGPKWTFAPRRSAAGARGALQEPLSTGEGLLEQVALIAGGAATRVAAILPGRVPTWPVTGRAAALVAVAVDPLALAGDVLVSGATPGARGQFRRAGAAPAAAILSRSALAIARASAHAAVTGAGLALAAAAAARAAGLLPETGRGVAVLAAGAVLVGVIAAAEPAALCLSLLQKPRQPGGHRLG